MSKTLQCSVCTLVPSTGYIVVVDEDLTTQASRQDKNSYCFGCRVRYVIGTTTADISPEETDATPNFEKVDENVRMPVKP